MRAIAIVESEESRKVALASRCFSEVILEALNEELFQYGLISALERKAQFDCLVVFKEDARFRAYHFVYAKDVLRHGNSALVFAIHSSDVLSDTGKFYMFNTKLIDESTKPYGPLSRIMPLCGL